MVFEWDDNKNAVNIVKHGIDFETAAYVFADEQRIIRYDESHSLYENRYTTIGSINAMITVLVVVYTENDETVRIISARLANKKERKEYYDCQKGD